MTTRHIVSNSELFYSDICSLRDLVQAVYKLLFLYFISACVTIFYKWNNYVSNINTFTAGTVLYTSESDVCKRQVLTSPGLTMTQKDDDDDRIYKEMLLE